MTDIGELKLKVTIDPPWWRLALDIVARTALRDVCFWFGLLLIWAGIAGFRSVWLATAIAGALLFTVAVFGVAPSRGKS